MIEPSHATVVTSDTHDYDLIMLQFKCETYAFPLARTLYLADREAWLDANNPDKKDKILDNIKGKKPYMYLSFAVEKGHGEQWVRDNTNLEPRMAIATMDSHMNPQSKLSVD